MAATCLDDPAHVVQDVFPTAWARVVAQKAGLMRRLLLLGAA